MERIVATLRPRSAFGGPIRGDTLFGQLCWALRHRYGEARLAELLQGYTDGTPFLVVSDAFPTGFLPRPALPLYRFAEVPGADRKQVKKRCWLPREHFSQPLSRWLTHAVAEGDIVERLGAGGAQEKGRDLIAEHSQPHNTINRLTGTTGTGEFAPYAEVQYWFAPALALDVYIACDARRISPDDIRQLLDDVGAGGYGRDASIGLGKFAVEEFGVRSWPVQDGANSWMTLAPCAPQGLGFKPEKSWYQPFTRFGRHGDIAVHGGRPFKNPVLLADSAALLTPRNWQATTFTGQGLGGDGSLSRAIKETVHQGYAPVLAVRLEA